MKHAKPTPREPETSQIYPWYRYPWPWVAIGIPATAVVGGLFTLYLALTNPDPLVVDDPQYHELRSGLQAEAADLATPVPPGSPDDARNERDGDR